MKCICGQKDLKDALDIAAKALPTNPQTPILNGIYILAIKNMLEVHATDFSNGIISKLPAEIEAEGAIVVKGKDITEIIGKLSGNIVTISTEDEGRIATFVSDGTKFSLYTMDAEEYPRIIMEDLGNKFYIKNQALKKLISSTTFACADEKDARPVFQGCSITLEGEEINFVATNTHRLVVVKDYIEYSIDDDNAINFVVPGKSLNKVLGILNEIRDERGVKVDFSDKQIAFTINQYYIICRLIDGTFPAHDKVIPESSSTTANLKIKDFNAAISRVEIISRQTEFNTVIMKFDDDNLELKADSYASGKVVDHLDAMVEGPAVEIAFNIRYIKEFLKIADESKVVFIGMNDNLSPVEFKIADDDNITYVVTPIRT